MKIAIMGYGVVGSGVGEILQNNQESFLSRINENIEVKYILDLRDFSNCDYDCFIKDFNIILNDAEITAVVETMGGTVPAYEYTKKLLLSGKHVVTSNKELVAKHGTELLKIAKDNNINYMFEASVGGGIPVIRPMYSCLTAGEIDGIYGILNGTTNYILSRMINDGVDFKTALSSAQQKGYAEKDPSADIDGIDACRKISILASLAFGKWVNCEDVPTEGIRNITLNDVEYAEKFGYSIKLIGSCRKASDGVYARVCPMLVSVDNPLSSISGVFNGILIKGEEIGEVMFYGKGAGKLPTASAVVADIIDIAKHKNKNVVIKWEDAPDNYLLAPEDCKYSYYIRLKGGIISDFSDLDTLIIENSEFENEFAFLTPLLNEKELESFLSEERFIRCNILGMIRVL